ncbi:hypothetical protein HZ326_26132 [Fusarium oxysporum f. sp. albedinis]|nr:hypothetical protein HZ326_26132 [Fusarium oxysporum f. sp. albedinis]
MWRLYKTTKLFISRIIEASCIQQNDKVRDDAYNGCIYLMGSICSLLAVIGVHSDGLTLLSLTVSAIWLRNLWF